MDAYNQWKADTVTSNGAGGARRVQRLASDPVNMYTPAGSTVSEGISYGMMMAVFMNDRPLFDDLWNYSQKHLNGNGLMHWSITADGMGTPGEGAATDADEDIAFALVMAHRQWGARGALDETYLSHARRQIDRIWEFEVDHGERAGMLLPGDGWRGRDVFNPSYFAPDQYRLFGEVSGNVAGWQRVIDTGYAIVEKSLNDASGNRDNGLVPAWCTAGGAPVEAFPGAMTNYQYDSARLPFRVGQDFAYHKEPRARAYLAKISAFFAARGAHAIVDGYTLKGEDAPDPRAARPNPGSAVFVGTAAVGAMHDVRYRAFVDAAYDRVRTGELLARSRYYNHSWTVLSLLMLTGNLNVFPE
jgi:endo-1,4-beta-D-glucanase Y